VVAASVLSCNLRFPPLCLLVHGSSFNDSPSEKGPQGLSPSLIYPDPVLHVVLSPPTFRHALLRMYHILASIPFFRSPPCRVSP